MKKTKGKKGDGAARSARKRGTDAATGRAERGAKLPESIYRMAVEAARDGILLVDPDGLILDANKTYVTGAGYGSAEELIGTSVFDVVATDTVDELRESVMRALNERGYVANLEVSARTKDGRQMPVEVTISELMDEEGVRRGAVIVIRDITERKRAQDEVLRHSRRIEALHAISIAVSQTLNLEEMLGSALKTVLEVTGMDGGYVHFLEMETRELVLRAHRGVSERYVAAIQRIEVSEHGLERWLSYPGPAFGMGGLLAETALAEARKAAEEEGIRSFVAVPLWSKSGMQGGLALVGHTPRHFCPDELELLQAIGGEIAMGVENARLLERMRELSITDELTRLYNRRHFHAVLELEMNRTQRYGRPFTLALLDLDGFKEYNDKFGHTNGDAVLRSLGETLRSSLRKTDTGFRYGGDEFAIILPATDAARARRIVDRIRSEWLQAPKADGLILESPLGFSAGIAQFPDDAETAGGLIFLADTALYRSKRRGGYQSTLVADLGTLPSDMTRGATLEEAFTVAAKVDAKDPYTSGHSKRVADIAEMIGKEIGLQGGKLADLRTAGALHDIGKASLPQSVLTKPGRLTDEEWRLVQMHAGAGARMVESVEGLAHLAPSIGHHHEWYDGTGYPDGLAGEDIPLGARVIGIADAYDTMTTPRGYRTVLSREEALRELRWWSGRQFDPVLVDALASALSGGAAPRRT